MMQTPSNYPTALDTNQNLFQVNDALRVVLAEDYTPGDTSITILDPYNVMTNFSSTGIITLTEQCSEPELRASSFYYGAITATTFEQLELLPGFVDVGKPALVTNITQNVMAEHHNALVNALIAIEDFAGLQNQTPSGPLQGTMEQRINYLRSIALTPKAWFTVDKTIGLVPLTVTFTDQSFRLAGDGTNISVNRLWDFGDNTGPSIITITETTQVPSNITNVLVNDPTSATITKTYTKPGIYSPILEVTNAFGSDTVQFPNLIIARFPAPNEAVINFNLYTGQILTETGSPIGGPYTTFPTIRSVINSLINISISSGINTNTGETYGGETVDQSNNPIDPIVDYIWSISDDLPHNNSPATSALFSIGGFYDLTLRVNTEFGSYHITSYTNSFDIVENYNLWLWIYNQDKSVSSSEFGLISEVFKTVSTNSLTIATNNAFLTGQNNEAQQKAEFARNNGFITRGSASSGNSGSGLLYWASGRTAIASASTETVTMSEFNGFLNTYTSRPSLYRPWNWISFGSSQELYFVLGGITTTPAPSTSPTNQVKSALFLNNLSVSNTTLGPSNYNNGAGELSNNEVTYDINGNSLQGNMSVYRATWFNSAGFFLRNEGVGDFFRIQSFYKTSGVSAELFQNISKLPNMSGTAKTEGQLISLSQGVYFFNNSGSVSAYNPTSGIWAQGGPGLNSIAFRNLQDTSVIGFDNLNNTLLATSDGANTAYLSYDYSANAFIKFNEIDTTFSSVSSRPTGTQWQMTIF